MTWRLQELQRQLGSREVWEHRCRRWFCRAVWFTWAPLVYARCPKCGRYNMKSKWLDVKE
jgi:hypothetical protein